MKKIFFFMSIAALATACSNDNDWDATGTFEATEVVVSAKCSGEIMSFNIEEGQEVDANTQIGYLDMSQLDIQQAQYDANLLNLDATNANLDADKQNLDATLGGLDANKENFDASKAQLDANKQQMSENKAQMNSSKKQISATQNATTSHILDNANQVASIRQQIANLQKEKARFSTMLKDDAASQKQVDDINYQILVLEKQLAATQEQLESNNKGLSSQNNGYAAQKEGVDAQMRGVDAQMRGVDEQKRGIDAQKRGVDAQKRGVDAKKRGIDAQKRGIYAQKQGINAQKAMVDNQKQNSIIMSPVKGTILAKYAQCGEFATTGKPLFKVADMSTVYLRAYFSSDQLADIKLGQQVTVVADFGGGKTREYTGKVTWISSESEFTPKSIQTKDSRANLVYAVKIAVRNDGYLKLGLSGNVKLK